MMKQDSFKSVKVSLTAHKILRSSTKFRRLMKNNGHKIKCFNAENCFVMHKVFKEICSQRKILKFSGNYARDKKGVVEQAIGKFTRFSRA